MASRLEAITSRLEAIATRVEAIEEVVPAKLTIVATGYKKASYFELTYASVKL